MRRHPRRAGGGLERAGGERAGWGGCAVERATPRLPPPSQASLCSGPSTPARIRPRARGLSAPGWRTPLARAPVSRRIPFPARRRRPRPTSRSRHCFPASARWDPAFLAEWAGGRRSPFPSSVSAGSLASVLLVRRARGSPHGLRAWQGLDLPAEWSTSQFCGARYFLESSHQLQVPPKDVWRRFFPRLFSRAPEALQGEMQKWGLLQEQRFKRLALPGHSL